MDPASARPVAGNLAHHRKQLTAYVASEADKWGRFVKLSGAKVD